jgi:hypothetical protein
LYGEVTLDVSKTPSRQASVRFGLTMVVGLGGFTWLDPNPTHFGGTNCGVEELSSALVDSRMCRKSKEWGARVKQKVNEKVLKCRRSVE